MSQKVPCSEHKIVDSAKCLTCIKTNIQATVDHECRFTSYELGWPGSVTDVKIWKNSHIWMHRRKYFKNGEYILLDKGMISLVQYSVC